MLAGFRGTAGAQHPPRAVAAAGVAAGAQAANTMEAKIKMPNTLLIFLDMEFLLLENIEEMWIYRLGSCSPEWESQLPELVYCLILDYARLQSKKSMILSGVLEYLQFKKRRSDRNFALPTLPDTDGQP